MLENILVGASVVIVFGAAVFVWLWENGHLEGKEKDEDKTEKALDEEDK